MTSVFDVLTLAGKIGTVLIYAYATYWSFGMRRILAVRLYRNQALGIGLGSSGFALLNVAFVFNVSFGFGAILSLLPFIFFFYWIDSSVSAARRSDPHLRDVLRWRQMRVLLWPLVLFSYVSLYPILTVNRQFQTCLPVCRSYVDVLFFVPIFVILASGALYLPMSAKRSKDTTLRKHFAWFGLFTLCLLAAALFSIILYPDFLLSTIAFIAGGYCLYRSAISLVPFKTLLLNQPRPMR